MQGRADIQDLPAVFFELAERGATNIERALQIDIDYRAEGVWRKFFRCAENIPRGATGNEGDVTFQNAISEYAVLHLRTHLHVRIAPMILVLAGAGASKAVDPKQYPSTVEFFESLPQDVQQEKVFKLAVEYLKK